MATNDKKCKHCKRPRGDHKAKTLNCPAGLKHRVTGYTNYTNYLSTTYESKDEHGKD